MKKLSIGLSALIILFINGCTGYPVANIFIIMGLFIIFLPMIIIEATALAWLFKKFDAERAIFASLVVNFSSIVLLMTLDEFGFIPRIDNSTGIAILVINLFFQLLLLKLIYKATLSISGVIAFIFAHSVSAGLITWWTSMEGVPGY